MTPSEWDEETKRAVREKIRMEEENMIKDIVRPPGSLSPDGRDFEVRYKEVTGRGWTTDYRYRYLEQAEGRARALLSFGKASVKILQVIDYHCNA